MILEKKNYMSWCENIFLLKFRGKKQTFIYYRLQFVARAIGEEISSENFSMN